MRFPCLATLLVSLAVLAVSCAPSTQTETSGSAITRKSRYDRVEALLARMTLDEKLAQISCVWFGKADIRLLRNRECW
ncbi:MAG: hypothetical protein GDA39_05225 [Hyphomonadaceae bacterium]|nr:hypothetical protein [Hyphomonadaceae bacterium]